MTKTRDGLSAARRNAETLLNRSMRRDSNLRQEQDRKTEAMADKTARLRELRLAKEAEEKLAAPAAAPAKPRRQKPRRSKQT
jgi:hypothetical protein